MATFFRINQSGVRGACMENRMIDVVKDYFETRVSEENTFQGKPVVFLSYTDGEERATVVKGHSDSYALSFDEAADKLKRHIQKTGHFPRWLKVDWVTETAVLPYKVFKEEWLSAKLHYYRKGVSFDPAFKLAFLEQEMNANAFIVEDKKQKKKRIHWRNVHHYIKQNSGHQLWIDERMIRQVIVFQTESFFFDGRTFVDLSTAPYFNGQRKRERYNIGTLYEMIDNASQYLAEQVEDSGAYQYGVFPYFQRAIGHYNILRHASSTYALIESYEVTRRSEFIPKIQVALDYLIDTAYYEKVLLDGTRVGYIREASSENEIKLGANAAALLALSKHYEVFGKNTYKTVAQRLSQGIITFFREGRFVHVLDADADTVKEAFRIIYYEGEAVFALLKYYEWCEDTALLEFCETVFEHFYEAQYEQFADHWLSYASYHLFKYRPSTKLFAFNLANAGKILPFASTRETTYATLLELFMATDALLEHNRHLPTPYEIPETFDETFFQEVVNFRVVQGFSGYMYPEVAMYFKAPMAILDSFYIRHHSFRIRIDDVEHALSGYCRFYYKLRR